MARAEVHVKLTEIDVVKDWISDLTARAERAEKERDEAVADRDRVFSGGGIADPLDVACALEFFDEHGHPMNAAAIRRLLAAFELIRPVIVAAQSWYGDALPAAEVALWDAIAEYERQAGATPWDYLEAES